jgi:hypothetical protein
MIVAIEGAPGVGKSTTAARLADAGALVIPEVNLLFARPEGEAASWYYDRQNARWEMAVLAARQCKLVVLDGDPFQPVWFNWAFACEGFEDWRKVLEFYRCRVGKGRIAFPDRYVFLTVDEAVRQERMLARERARGLGEERAQLKTSRYARLVAPQARFFRALAARFPGWVVELEAASLEKNVASVLGLGPLSAPPGGLEVLDFMEAWLDVG